MTNYFKLFICTQPLVLNKSGTQLFSYINIIDASAEKENYIEGDGTMLPCFFSFCQQNGNLHINNIVGQTPNHKLGCDVISPMDNFQ